MFFYYKVIKHIKSNIYLLLFIENVFIKSIKIQPMYQPEETGIAIRQLDTICFPNYDKSCSETTGLPSASPYPFCVFQLSEVYFFREIFLVIMLFAN